MPPILPSLIIPNGDIYFCRVAGLDSSYSDTLTFSSASSQSSFFITKHKYHFTDCVPVKVGRSIRVQMNVENLIDCNYIMFRNTNFGIKYFYAFVTNLTYINPSVTEVEYEIDVMQTWFFETVYRQSVVLREHVSVANDTVGSNTLPEPVALGEYTYLNQKKVGSPLLSEYGTICAVKGDSGYTSYNKIFCGCILIYASNTTDSLTALSNYIESKTPSDIVSVYTVPLASVNGRLINHPLINNLYIVMDDFAIGGTPTFPTIDISEYKSYNYTVGGIYPKCNKLYTYPYNYLIVHSTENSMSLRLEYFNGNAELGVNTSLLNPVGVNVYPKNYKGVIDCYVENLSLNNYPQCTYVTDTYKQYLANSQIPNAMSTGLSVVGNVISGNYSGAINSVANYAINDYSKSLASDVIHGSLNSGSINISHNQYSIHTMLAQIPNSFALQADDFMYKYGYTTNRLKVPNISSRKYWNYVKLEKANIVGNISFNDLSKIKNVLENGITFWHGDYIGNYSLNNNEST